MTNIGIVGLGFMAVAHIKAYRQLNEANVAAICNPSGRRLDGDLSDVAGNIGDQEPVKLDMSKVKAYQSMDDLLADREIQVVDICAPTAKHAELTLAALQSGKHVLCEKPMARTSQQCRELVAAAERASGLFMPAMCLRFWPEWSWLKRAVEKETYGKVLDARFRRVAQPPGWGQQNYFDGNQSGGALLDLHIHDTDFVQYCFGRPKAVYSRGYSKFSGAIDYVHTHYDVAGGALVHAECSWNMADGFGFNMAYTVNFEGATADYDIARAEEPLVLAQNGKRTPIRCEPADGYVNELRHFLESIQAGTPPSMVTAQDGLSAVEICEAEEESVRSGKTVAL